jgi:hypothetical protein
MGTPSVHEVTQLLRAWSAGDRDALAKLTPLFYRELHHAAKRYMARQQPDHTLQTTALVNAVHLRLVAFKEVRWEAPATHKAVQKLAVVNLVATPDTALSLEDVDPRVGAAGAGTSIQFTPDGKGVAYVIEEHGVDNVWIQPLDGSRGVRLHILPPNPLPPSTGPRTASPSHCCAPTPRMTPSCSARPSRNAARSNASK